MAAKEAKEDKPVSEIYYIPKGNMVRLWASGWHCTCGGSPENECEHIPTARALHNLDNKKPPKGSEEQ